MEMIDALPRNPSTPSRSLSHRPSSRALVRGSDDSKRMSWTARLCSDQVRPGNRNPASWSASRLALMMPWRKVVPVFMAPMWR